jgi:WD40 repeat protein/serine/threonine protein kinase
MPHTDPSDESIFALALERPSRAERAAFVQGACVGDPSLLARVEGLLKSHEEAGSFLQQPIESGTLSGGFDRPSEGPGTRIGAYKLLQQIGEGGMGVVYMAEQEQPVRRKVALKIIKPGMDSQQVVARFEAERQALAVMDHTHIAKVFDAGATESGRPYFVMELVHGVSITKYCDDNQLTPRERLELFVPVCQAIQHAHQKGIVHRDVKPTNVLVTMYDDKPVPKVIDFGVAKAIDQRLTERTLFTQYGALVGTFEYMSPEQAEMNAFGVDTRSDIYSLGVLLYELLTGTTPLEKLRLRQAALDELIRLIKEEEPPRPSVRLSSSGDLPKIAALRKTEPARLSKLVRGEVDWIVMKCLEKDRARRYETASGLAKDVERYLADLPVEACPPSTGYRLHKFARRFKVPLAVTAGFGLLLLAGVVFSTWLAVRAKRAEEVAHMSEINARLNEQTAQDQKREVALAKDNAEKRGEELVTLNEQLHHSNYIADVNLARHAWDEGNLALVGELLERHRPKVGETDSRGFEWHYLHRLPHRDLRTVNAHAGGATTVAWTPDGKRLISLGTSQKASGEVKLWDAATLTPLPLPLKGATNQAVRGDLSPDGKLLAAGGRDKLVRVWNLETGEEVAALEGHTADFIWQVCFSPDGKHLASRTWNSKSLDSCEIKIWDLDTRKAIVSIDNLRAVGGRALAFTRDGERLAAGNGPNLVNVWDAASGRELLVTGLKRSSVESLTTSPDGERLAVAGIARDVQILDAHTGAVVSTCSGDLAPRGRLIFSPDGQRLASASSGGIELWDTESGQLIRVFKGHVGPVTDVAFSPDGALLASTGGDGCVKVWDAISDPGSIPISGPLARLFVVISPEGRTALTGIGESTIQLWNTTTGKPLGEPLQLEDQQASLDFTADGNGLVLTDQGKNVTIWDVAACKLVHTFKHDGPTRSIRTALSANGKWFACSGAPGELKVWDVEKGSPSRVFQAPKDQLSLVFSPDGTLLAVGDRHGAVKIWHFATGQERCATDIKGAITMLCFSPNGKQLAAECSGREVRMLDAQSGQEVSPPFSSIATRCIQFSPDGKRLATGLLDGTVKIWDPSGRETLTLKGHTGLVSGLAFSPDGHRLISAGADMTVRFWDATPMAE